MFSTNFVQYQAYIVIYEPGTKYLIISEIVFLKNPYFKNTKKIFCFRAYDQILKFVQAYFYKKQKLHFFHVLKCKMNIVISLLLSVTVWPKYQKSFTIYFVHFIFKVLGFSCKF
jgi:hypothetical protein